MYSERTTARLLEKTEVREDGQPLREIRSEDWMEDVRLSSNLLERNFRYGDDGRLSRVESASEDVYSFVFDRDGNLTQVRNETYGYQSDYEWIAVSIPMY